ncbi:MAG: zinc dependent phospholipase C family protein [Candidatus Solibacter sp.]|nr:zinc dependent phospholipase C family protein [Candidatus Solibacter sp.]
MTTQYNVRLPWAAFGLLVLFSCPNANAYSVLTHEAIIDSTWDSAIRPLLLKRFPAATADELTAAHAYAYGGCIIQDLGYYPFGSKLFSDLTHYVRSGDFIRSMIRESQDLDEYAFALGALSHFAADNNGHPMATNVSVPLLYPKLGLKFGKSVTYADDPFSHSKTEFGFDVFQSAKSRYASAAYKSFIGFQVAKPVLQRAFQDTYGMRIEQVFLNLDMAIGSYRRAVGTILPALTKVAWQIKGQEIRREVPGITRKKFLYNLSRSSYEKNWGGTYQRPGIRSRILAAFFRIVPRVGPFTALAFEKLTPETEKMYMIGFNASIDRYRELLLAVGGGRLRLPNDNIDVGEVTKAGKYTLTDGAYAKLLHKLEGHYVDLPQDLRSDILAFYQDLSLPIATKANEGDWARLQEELSHLAAVNRDLVAGSRVSTVSGAVALK